MIKKEILYGIKIGCWHSSYMLYMNSNSKRLIKKSLNTLDYTIVLSENDKKLIKENFDVDVKVIPNPLFIKEPIKSSLRKKKFISVGRYSFVKGFDRVIKCFKIFNEKNKEWTLDIIGEGPERKKLQNLINSYGLTEYITLRGKVDNIQDYYHNASCALISSRDEGFGLCLTEAMAFGLPIIAFDVPVFHEILPKNYEYIVKQDKYDIYAEKMVKIANNFDERKKIGNQLSDTVKKYEIDSIISEWYKILK